MSFKTDLAEALEVLDSTERRLIESIGTLRGDILSVRREIWKREQLHVGDATSLVACDYCDSLIRRGALVCRFCRRPSFSNRERYAVAMGFIQSRLASFSGE